MKKSELLLQAVAVNTAASPSLGTVANNLNAATSLFTGIFADMFHIIGIALVTASIIQYRNHRMNSQQTPLSRVLWLLLAGLAIGALPWLVSGFGQHVSQYNVAFNG